MNEIYYKITKEGDVCCLQRHDEYGYVEGKFIKDHDGYDYRFDSEQEAKDFYEKNILPMTTDFGEFFVSCGFIYSKETRRSICVTDKGLDDLQEAIDFVKLQNQVQTEKKK